MVVFFSALFYRPINTHEQPTEKEDKKKRAKFIDMSIFQNKAYVIWCASLAVFILGYFVPFVHLVSKFDIFYLLFFLQVVSKKEDF